MKYDWIDGYLMAQKGVVKDFKVEWNWRRYMIEDKMFVAVCFDDDGTETLITLKLDPMEGEFLRQQYKDIIPGYYMNKTHWNSIRVDGEVPDDLMKDMLDKAYNLVLNGFSKKKQAEILGKSSSYRYLLWDVDGTVLDFLAAENAAIRSLFVKYDFGVCTDEMLMKYSAINVKYWQALERGEMTKSEILIGRFLEFFESEGLDTSKAETFNSEYQTALGDTIVFRDDAMTVLNAEKGRFILAAVTNGTLTAQKKKLRRSGLDRVFDYICISEQIGAEKPDPVFFERVFEKIGLTDKSEALIIGDSLTSDILGGIRAGIDTCWYNPDRTLLPDGSIVPKYIISDLHKLNEIL